MPIHTKRWCDPRNKADGFRLMICRYRPRALPKADETWDHWCPDLGPSKELHAAIYSKSSPPLAWEEIRVRYLKEMAEQDDLVQQLADMVREGKTVTLLCSSACEDESHCHRTLLKGLVEERMQAKK